MNMELIEKFLIEECGYKSIEDAKAKFTPMNLYPIYGEINWSKVQCKESETSE